jgi:hypothetical protein
MSGELDTMASIQNLQNIEKQLQQNYASQTPENQLLDLTKMEELAQLRVDLFNKLKVEYSNDIATGTDDLRNQLSTLRIVEEQLRDAKKEMKGLEQAQTDKMRMVEFSTYFSEKYKAYNKVFLLILMWIVIIGVVIFISHLNFIPERFISKQNVNNIFLIILTVLSLYALYKILTSLNDIYKRNNMNFNEYDFGSGLDLEQIVKQEHSKKDDSVIDLEGDLNLGCMDSNCCADGTMYDSLKKQCIPIIKDFKKSNASSSLTKGIYSPTNDVNSVSNSQVEPFTGDNVPFASV